MTALAAQVVVMPIWVFLLLFVGGVLLITFLLWANSTQAHDLRRLRRQREAHNRRHHAGTAGSDDDGRIPLAEILGGGEL